MKSDLIQFGKNDFEIVKEDLLYQGIFRMVRRHIKQKLFNGGWSDVYIREVLERFSAAAILPYDPKLDRVILIEQFRAGTTVDPQTAWTLEIPAGVLHPGDTPEKIAINEADEEAGCKILALLPILEFYVTPGASNEYLWMYCGIIDATNVQGIHGLKHEHEDIRVHNISYDEAIRRLNANEIKTVPAVIALLWLQINREKLRADFSNWTELAKESHTHPYPQFKSDDD